MGKPLWTITLDQFEWRALQVLVHADEKFVDTDTLLNAVTIGRPHMSQGYLATKIASLRRQLPDTHKIENNRTLGYSLKMSRQCRLCLLPKALIDGNRMCKTCMYAYNQGYHAGIRGTYKDERKQYRCDTPASVEHRGRMASAAE